jgi:hypothetical protein
VEFQPTWIVLAPRDAIMAADREVRCVKYLKFCLLAGPFLIEATCIRESSTGGAFQVRPGVYDHVIIVFRMIVDDDPSNLRYVSSK